MAREPQPPTEASVETTDLPGQPSATPAACNTKPLTKTAIIFGLLTRSEGVTLAHMVEVTGWLPHTARAALTGFRKKGHAVTSEVVDGVRTYRLSQTADPE